MFRVSNILRSSSAYLVRYDQQQFIFEHGLARGAGKIDVNL